MNYSSFSCIYPSSSFRAAKCQIPLFCLHGQIRFSQFSPKPQTRQSFQVLFWRRRIEGTRQNKTHAIFVCNNHEEYTHLALPRTQRKRFATRLALCECPKYSLQCSELAVRFFFEELGTYHGTVSDFGYDSWNRSFYIDH